MFENKKKTLLNFLYQHNNLPKQGSKEWLENRKFTIGGSEMAVITGDNPFGTIKDLIKTKLGWKQFIGSPATDWGKVFEPCAQLLLEKIFKCIIHETGSLPGCIEHTSYSPDGFATVRAETIHELYLKGLIKDHEIPGIGKCSELTNMQDEAINVVFEIKSPYKRIPKIDVPSYYIPQPLSALSHFDFLDIAYFADILFRTCKYEDFDNLNYNKFIASDSYHNFDTVLYKGVIGFATENNNFNWVKSLDLGQLSQVNLESLFYSAVIENTQVFHFDIDEPPKKCEEKLLDICEKNDLNIIGILPYKIYKLQLTPIYRIPNYVQQFQQEINKFFSIINEINNSENAKKKFDEIFEIVESDDEEEIFVD